MLEEVEKFVARRLRQRSSRQPRTTLLKSSQDTFPPPLRLQGLLPTTNTHRKPDFWATYRERIRAVTADDVLRVAQKYLHPEKMVILAVGNVDDMLKGNPDKPKDSFRKLAKDGEIKRIPLPDPLTMVYPKN